MSTQSIEYLELEAKIINAKDRLKEMLDEMQLSIFDCKDRKNQGSERYYTGQVDGLGKAIAVIEQDVLEGR